MDKHLNFGVYEATSSFQSIKQHSCVCFDDMGLVAVTGPADDKESQRYAQLFAAAPDLLKSCKKACEFIEQMVAQWNEYDDEYLEDDDRAMLDELRAAIAKATTEIADEN